MFRVVLVRILSCYCILLVGCTKVPHRPNTIVLQERSAYAPYWYIDDETDSFIEVKNLLDSPLTLLPTVITISGQSLQLKPLTVAPQSTERLNLKSYVQLNSQGLLKSLGGKAVQRWGDGSRPNSQLGCATLTAIAPDNSDEHSFSAWIVIKNNAKGLGVVSTFHPPHLGKPDRVLEGLWWLPYRDTQAYFALQNSSRQPIDVQMELYSNGKAIKSKHILLGASAFEFINIGDVLAVKEPPEIGGIRFSYKSKSGQQGGVVARGLLVQENIGFCSPLNMYESVHDKWRDMPSELQAPVAYFGKLGELVPESKHYLHPHLLLRNTAEHPITVRGTLYGKNVRGQYVEFQLQPVTLRPESPIDIDLENQRVSHSDLADGVAGLRLTHDGIPTAIVAELINVSETGGLAFYDRMTNMYFHGATEQVAISLGQQSFLLLKNTTDRPQLVSIIFDHAAGLAAYDVLIPSQQVEIVDIKHLRDTAALDEQGPTVSRVASLGGARIFSEPGAIVTSDPTFSHGPDITGDEGEPRFKVVSCVVSVVKSVNWDERECLATTVTARRSDLLPAKIEVKGHTYKYVSVGAYRSGGDVCRPWHNLEEFPFGVSASHPNGNYRIYQQPIPQGTPFPGVGHRVMVKVRTRHGALVDFCCTIVDPW